MFKNFKNTMRGSWLRILARVTDYSLFYIFIAFSMSFLPYFLGVYTYLVALLAVPLLWIPIEALLLSRYGSTPGKALFRMKVKKDKGGRLTFKEALKQAAFLTPRPGVLSQMRMGAKRKLAALVLSGCCLLTALFGKPLTYYSIGLDNKISNNGWMQYYSMTRGFTVNFPNDPKEQSKQLEIPESDKVLNYQEISSQQTKDVLYSVSYMELPSKWRWAGSNTLLKGALDLLVKYSPEPSEVTDREIILYQNHRALDFHLKQGDNEVSGRFILVDNTLYKLTVIYPSSLNKEVENGNPFLNSFDLNPKGVTSKENV